jgi:branched-chain amino acid transport system permease protein
MATETPLEGDVYDRRKQAVIDKILLRDLTLRHKLGVLGMVGLALLPTIMTPRELSLFTGVLYVMMFAISWDVVSGYTGQLSFGHAFFFALGGYGTAVITNQHLFPLFDQSPAALGTGWTLAIVMAGIVGGTLVAAIGGVLIGVPALRLEGPYLSLVTLIAPLLLYQSLVIFSNKLPYLAPKGLGGSGGLADDPTQLVSTGTNSVVRVEQFWQGAVGQYYISFLALLVVLGVCYAVTRSSAGSVFTGIREDEDAVRSVGLNPAKFKIFAFLLSAAVGGFAAAVWMHTGGNPDTESLLGPARIDLSINVIVVAIIGGMGTIVGAVVGALLLGITETIVSSLGWLTIPLTDLSVADTSPLPTFALGILVLVFMPEGVVPRATEAGRRYLARRRGEEVPERGGVSAAKSAISNYREEIEDVLDRDNQ